MKKVNITEINYSCGCVGKIYQKQKAGKTLPMWYSDKTIVCPHN